MIKSLRPLNELVDEIVAEHGPHCAPLYITTGVRVHEGGVVQEWMHRLQGWTEAGRPVYTTGLYSPIESADENASMAGEQKQW